MATPCEGGGVSTATSCELIEWRQLRSLLRHAGHEKRYLIFSQNIDDFGTCVPQIV
jgi:hypothetical protein